MADMTTPQLILLLGSNLFATLFSGGIVWLFTFKYVKRKAKAEASGLELDNIEKAVNIWRSLAQTLEKRVDSVEAQLVETKEEVKEQKKLTEELKTVACYKDECENRVAYHVHKQMQEEKNKEDH
jgi:hypothetical protein